VSKENAEVPATTEPSQDETQPERKPIQQSQTVIVFDYKSFLASLCLDENINQALPKLFIVYSESGDGLVTEENLREVFQSGFKHIEESKRFEATSQRSTFAFSNVSFSWGF
jgi:hypothetical protein